MNLEKRVAALEERVGMESGLRASADRDLSSISQTLSAQRHLIQALSITQSEHTDTLRDHTESLALAHRKLDQIIGLLNVVIAKDNPNQHD